MTHDHDTPTHWHTCPSPCGYVGEAPAKLHDVKAMHENPPEFWWLVYCPKCRKWDEIDGEPQAEPNDEPDLDGASADERAELLQRELREAGR